MGDVWGERGLHQATVQRVRCGASRVTSLSGTQPCGKPSEASTWKIAAPQGARTASTAPFSPPLPPPLTSSPGPARPPGSAAQRYGSEAHGPAAKCPYRRRYRLLYQPPLCQRRLTHGCRLRNPLVSLCTAAVQMYIHPMSVCGSHVVRTAQKSAPPLTGCCGGCILTRACMTIAAMIPWSSCVAVVTAGNPAHAERSRAMA